MRDSMRSAIKRRLPGPVLLAYRIWARRDPRDAASALKFLSAPTTMASLPVRLHLLQRIYAANAIRGEHTQDEMLQVIRAILDFPRDVPGCVVEAGCFKGGSTAKLSIAAKLAGRQLYVFDSFEGLPQNAEPQQLTILGDLTDFSAGQYRAPLDEVQQNVSAHGENGACVYMKGWFDQTMPQFAHPVIAAYIDVDLVSSTRSCLKYLYPILQPGGSLFSQDAHLPFIIELLGDRDFWETEVGYPRPTIEGLSVKKLVRISKPLSRA